VFALLPEATIGALEKQSFKFYRWPLYAADTGGAAIRLVTSYATAGADVDEFIAAARRA
jgi:threonine aldolase